MHFNKIFSAWFMRDSIGRVLICFQKRQPKINSRKWKLFTRKVLYGED